MTSISRRRALKTTAAGAALTGIGLRGFPAIAQGARDKVTFGSNWVAQAEHGGYYQAVAKGFYDEHGLDVTVRPGGPQINHPQLLLAGRIDFNMGSNSFDALNYAAQDLPFLSVASIFQKDPQCLIAHPGVGHDSLEALQGKPIMVSAGARETYWQFLKARYGYTDEQIRPYTFNLGPFLTDPQAIQQGYISSEPYLIQQQGVDPVTLLLADGGYNSYSTTIETSRRLVEENPDLVQRFVDATILGWTDFIHGDPTPAFELIKQENPEMTDDIMQFSHKAMQDFELVDSGDTLDNGIGAMTETRWQEFHVMMAGEGVYDPDLDIAEAFTLDFVNKGVGLDLKRKLQG